MRENLKTMVTVTARVDRRGLVSTVSDVRRALDSSGLITGALWPR